MGCICFGGGFYMWADQKGAFLLQMAPAAVWYVGYCKLFCAIMHVALGKCALCIICTLCFAL